MTQPPGDSSDPAHLNAATRLLTLLVRQREEELTPGVMLALAGHLCHLAGGDGRGVYWIVHDPEGDQTQ